MSLDIWDERLLRLSDGDETVVYVESDNSAHVLTEDGSLLCGMSKYGFPLWFFDRAPMVLPWWATHDKRFKPWPAWPCQSCMGRLEGIPNSVDTSGYPGGAS